MQRTAWVLLVLLSPGLVESPSLGDAAVPGIRSGLFVQSLCWSHPRNAHTLALTKVRAARRASRLRGERRGAVGDLRKVACLQNRQKRLFCHRLLEGNAH